MNNLILSKGSGKLKEIYSINVDTNEVNFCQKMISKFKKNLIASDADKKKQLICGHCYSDRQLRTFRKNCKPKFQRNYKLFTDQILSEQTIEQLFNFRSLAIIRIHSHGEIEIGGPGLIQITNYVNIIKFNSNTTFTLWTKNLTQIKKYFKNNPKPKNLILIYSNPYVDNLDNIKLPKYFDKIFSNISDKTSKKINCYSDCINCLKCYDSLNSDTHIIEAIK